MKPHSRAVIFTAASAVLLAALLGVAGYWHSRDQFDPDRLASYYKALRVRPAEPVDPARVREAIALATDYLRRVNDESGRFAYLVNMNPSVPVNPDDYNIVRHAGTIYSLAMSNEVMPDPRTVEVMKRAAAYMRNCCVTEFKDRDMSAIWDPPRDPASKRPPSYKLGGAGLGLVALASVESIAPGSVPREELERLGRFGQYMQRWNGEFYSNYVPSKGGRQDPSQVLFYPGEMALGWLTLHQLDPTDQWIESSIKGLDYLSDKRADSGESDPDHWALIATAKLFDTANSASIPLPRERLINHSLQICDAMLERSFAPPVLPVMEGALVPKGIVTPTATSLEGLLAAMRFLPPDHPIVPHVASVIHRGVDFLIRAQVKDGPYAGAMPFAIARLPDGTDPGTAKFNRQVTEVRIDYVQHSLSAMIQYLQWTERRDLVPTVTKNEVHLPTPRRPRGS